MKQFIIILLTLAVFTACDSTNNVPELCECDTIMGLYYVNVTPNDSFYVDDIEYVDGKVNLYRTGAGYFEQKMANIFSYQLDDFCNIKFYNLDSTDVLSNITGNKVWGHSLLFEFYFSDKYESKLVPLGCHGFRFEEINSVLYTDDVQR